MTAAINRIRSLFFAHPGRVKLLLGIFFSVGIIGFAFPLTRELFMTLTPFAILLSILVLFIYHEPRPDSKTLAAFALVIILTWLTEAAGVATGTIFGSYSYGNGLGLKLLGTPLLIGVNWLLLIYTSSCIAVRLTTRPICSILFASALMVAYDFLMENISTDLDMWSFEGGMPPMRNYLAWFIIAAILHSALKLAGIRFSNRIAPFIFYIQALFFIILIIILRVSR